ncbi:sensor histidine kinase [Gilvimarinus chinensis]|uniref:sensor histidine kinase n=1 Tax=Gilvimarinus chinensis TaxID=396005 RepID=UPI0009FE9CCD|nr:sensor histidine kinase [Gilvimarinus chinensis]
MVKSKLLIKRKSRLCVLVRLCLIPLILSGNAYAKVDCPVQVLNESMLHTVNTANLSLLVLEDKERKFSVDNIKELSSSRFQESSGSISSVSRSGRLWIRICLTSESKYSDEWLLTLLPAYIESTEVYVEGLPYSDVKKQGVSHPFSNREYDYRAFVYPLNIKGEAVTTVHIKLDFYNRQAADVLLMTDKTFQRFSASEYITYGLYLGMVLLAAVINLIFWYRLRDRSYFLYAMSMILLASFSSITGGYASQFLFFNSNYPVVTLIMVNMNLCFAVFIGFLQSVFQLRRFYSRIYHVSRFYIAIFLVLAILFVLFSGPWLFRLNSIFTGTAIILFLFVSLNALFRHPQLRFYSIAFLPLQAALMLSVLKALGLGGWIPFVDHLPNVGGLVHVVLLNFVLARRAWQAEKDKELAKEELLQKVNAYNRELEIEVKERTEELDRANTELTEEISERAAIEVQLRQALSNEQLALREQKEFIAMVSHEFRSPLAVIDMAAQNLEAQMREPYPEILDRLRRIRNNSGRLTSLINNCLTTDRLASERTFELHTRPVDLCQFMEKLVSREIYQSRVELYLPDGPIISKVDPDLLSIALINVIENALKYSPIESRVLVDVTKHDSQIYIQVQDFGIGIESNSREKVFDKFYRAPNAQFKPGSGLGLYLSRNIMRQHLGTLNLVSSEYNVGCCFQFQWPLED